MECFLGFWITQLETGNNKNNKISGGKEVGEGENKARFFYWLSRSLRKVNAIKNQLLGKATDCHEEF